MLAVSTPWRAHYYQEKTTETSGMHGKAAINQLPARGDRYARDGARSDRAAEVSYGWPSGRDPAHHPVGEESQENWPRSRDSQGLIRALDTNGDSTRT